MNRGSSAPVAAFDSGENMQPIPNPHTRNAGISAYGAVPGCACSAMMPRPTASAPSPTITTYLGLIRSDRRPANGATNPDSSDIGAVSRPDSMGL